MNLGLLLFPALVGFLFLVMATKTRFSLMRLSGYQVVFVSALVGALFVVSGRVLVFLLDGRVAAIQSGWSNFAPFEGSGTIAVSAALAVGIAVFWNLMTDNEAAARRSARRSGNQILWLLRDSLAKNRMVEVTLKSNKCYVGYVHDTGVTAHRADPDIALIPMASGYRDDETLELVLTTFYGKRIAEFLDAQGDPLSWRFKHFQVAFPYSQIASVRLFDPTVYAILQSPLEDDGQAETAGAA